MVDLSGKRPMMLSSANCQKGARDTLTPITSVFAKFLLQTPEDERHGPVFALPGRDCGRRLTDSNLVSRVISDIGHAVGVIVDRQKEKFASAHDLRKSFGVRWAARVMPTILQDLMRHADIATTMKFYIGQNALASADVIWDTMDRLNGVNKNVNTPSTDVQDQEIEEAANP
jgi:integrase